MKATQKGTIDRINRQLYIYRMLTELKQQERYDSDESDSEREGKETMNQGIWLEAQVLKFMVFSSFNLNVLASKLQRRTNKVFKEMAKFIGTRTSTQCRSQNQKLVKKHKNVRRILKAYEMQIGKQEFEKACTEYFEQLKAMQSLKRKGKKNKPQNIVSVFTQTEFRDDSESSQRVKVKVEQQPIDDKNYVRMGVNVDPGMPLPGNGHP